MIPPVSAVFNANSDRNSEQERSSLLNLLKELAATHPALLRINKRLASNGKVDKLLCLEALKDLEGLKDRRSVRARYIISRMLRHKDG